MTRADSRLAASLDEMNTQGYLIDADGADSNQYYLSGFDAPDSFVTLYSDGEIHLLVSPLEYTRARSESNGDGVRSVTEFDIGAKFSEHGRTKVGPLTTAAFLAECGIDSVSVPVSFPTGTADVLRERGIDVVTDYDDAMSAIRSVKTDDEIESIAASQRANETAMSVAQGMLERATVEAGVVRLDGAALTSERVRRAIETTLLDDGFGLDIGIVAAGADGAKAHAIGSGPIRAGEPIIIDLAACNDESRYLGDMTRTFVKGPPDATVREWYDLTHEAYEAALETIEAGVTGEAVDDAVCDVFEREGYSTPRTDGFGESGFTHSTGHGVGLDLHEAPSLGRFGDELQAGHVVTVEPGLYEPGIGGVRLEDLVVVTETGYENLNEYPTELGVV